MSRFDKLTLTEFEHSVVYACSLAIPHIWRFILPGVEYVPILEMLDGAAFFIQR
jgi:hypothetical protein